jgi:hypothetical protein
MTYHTAIGTSGILYAGFIRDIADPIILESILARLKNGDVAGEYLNRVVGGVYCELIPRDDIATERAKEDPSRTLKAIYSRRDLEKRIAELRNPR